MRAIYKYVLQPCTTQTLQVKPLGNLPFKEQVLKVATQDERICVWCLVDQTQPEREVGIAIVGTGQMLPDYIQKENYVDTVMLAGGVLVFHAFVIPEVQSH